MEVGKGVGVGFESRRVPSRITPLPGRRVSEGVLSRHRERKEILPSFGTPLLLSFGGRGLGGCHGPFVPDAGDAGP